MTQAAPERSSSDNAIPEGWVSRSLDELGAFSNGINKPEEAFGKGHAFVNLLDVFGIPEINSTDECGLVVSTDGEKSRYSLFRGDVLFVRSSVKPSGVGLTTLVTHDLPGAVYSGFLLRFRNRGGLDLAFKRYCFHAEYFRNALIANSTVSANTNINQGALKQLSLLFPSSLIEQKAIATALKDIDDLIASLDALIAKKRDIKQAAMQQLLTGKTRLAGFKGEWIDKRIGSFCTVYSGGTPSTSVKAYYGSSIPWITSSNVNQGRVKSVDAYLTDLGLSHSSAKMVSAGTLLLALYGATAGIPAISDIDAAINQAVLAIIPDDADTAFLYYLFALKRDAIINKLTQGGQPNLSGALVRGLEISMPQMLEEQNAISQTLFDIDLEILKFVEKRAKINMVRQGMMQQLLTGRIRLV
ncbi:restriction endonuclease subunit S [Acetobacter thailandicus]|uniref:restriction endonuclease subunit S n=1 Tax=Acetobacter thailandicus TaxID=1502842 RepID=UPI001BA70F61|nr:restriction endonuclease subunit S [Acetobacter thailandicus]MBS0959747.1 restriction endonuclease subunit S [Acetobacter thailandicus]